MANFVKIGDIYINVAQVVYFGPYKGGANKTYIQFPGADDNYARPGVLIVSKSSEEVRRILSRDGNMFYWGEAKKK
jgi:hypothetical protein